MTWTTDLYDLPETIRYCTRCAMPNTRPGVTMDDEGVCSACRTHERRQRIDWDKRWSALERLCDKYRRDDGGWDCVITVSSGKDSAFQVHTMKERLGMNPLLISVGNIETTPVGEYNARWMSETFNCHLLEYKIPRPLARRMMIRAHERLLGATWIWDLAVYSVMTRLAMQSGIRLLVYGEDTRHLYSGDTKETPNALRQIENDVVKPVPLEEWCGDGVTMSDLAPMQMPTAAEIKASKIKGIFLSYFVPWSGFDNAQAARDRGWRHLWDMPAGWPREGQVDAYDQIDSASYWVHPWSKYPKLGHRMNTDRWCNLIREGRATRADAAAHIIANEHVLDPTSLRLFLEFVGKDPAWFWEHVDRFANRRMLEKRDGAWRLKPNVVEALQRGGAVEE